MRSVRRVRLALQHVRLTRARHARADYYCVQSQLFSHATMNVVQQSRLLWKHTKRISSD